MKDVFLCKIPEDELKLPDNYSFLDVDKNNIIQKIIINPHSSKSKYPYQDKRLEKKLMAGRIRKDVYNKIKHDRKNIKVKSILSTGLTLNNIDFEALLGNNLIHGVDTSQPPKKIIKSLKNKGYLIIKKI